VRLVARHGEAGRAGEVHRKVAGRVPVLKLSLVVPDRAPQRAWAEAQEAARPGLPEIADVLVRLADVDARDEPELRAEGRAAIGIAAEVAEMLASVGELRVAGGAVEALPIVPPLVAHRELPGQGPVGVELEARIERGHLVLARAEGAARCEHAQR